MVGGQGKGHGEKLRGGQAAEDELAKAGSIASHFLEEVVFGGCQSLGIKTGM